MTDIRVFYKKTDRAKYISHLDLMRTVQRAIVRARLNVWYTQGFNPHIYLTFALPLSLGVEGFGESFDIRIMDEEPNTEEIKQKLSDSLPMGIEITAVASPVHSASDIVSAQYEIEFVLKDKSNTEKISDEIKQVMNMADMTVMKKSKKGPKPVNLKDFIGIWQACPRDEVVSLTLNLPAGNSQNINPALLITFIVERLSEKPALVKIKRTKVCTLDGLEFC